MLEFELKNLLEEIQTEQYNDSQISWILKGARADLDFNLYMSKGFTSSQMKEIYTGLVNEINVYHYLDANYSHLHMNAIRTLLEIDCYDDNSILPNTPINELGSIKRELRNKNKQIRLTPTYKDQKIQEILDAKRKELTSSNTSISVKDNNVETQKEFDFDDFFDESLNNEDNKINMNVFAENDNKDDLLNDFLLCEYIENDEVIDYSSLSNYIRKFNVLNAEDEMDLFKKYHNGDIGVKRQLINHNLKLVNSISYKYRTNILSREELFMEGYFGLLEGIERFDYKLGNRFSTYASMWIRQKISRAIADYDSIIRIPVHVIETINKLSKAENELLYKNNYEPTNKELFTELMKDESFSFPIDANQSYIEKLKLNRQLLKLENYLEYPKEDESERNSFSVLNDTKTTSPEKYAIISEFLGQLTSSMSELTERQEKILKLRFGLEDGRERTLEEIGKDFNVTRERIRQIEAKSIKRLGKHHFKEAFSYYLDDFPSDEDFAFYKDSLKLCSVSPSNINECNKNNNTSINEYLFDDDLDTIE